ncbi:EAL domain-containing protein [Herbaspirillum huttiense]|uniref:EAL domain-containing protein n=1 Tax=Herbaspirillum huttiense TaxID=863372 RepID=UPI0039AFF0B7
MNTSMIQEILRRKMLQAVFQPIVATSRSEIIGYEGLIRGPASSGLESPGALFAAARAAGLQPQLEQECVRLLWTRFAAQRLPGKLFLNLSAAMLLEPATHQREFLRELAALGFAGNRIVIEITEEHCITDFRRLRRMTRLLRRYGMSVAVDDLGAGYASLRMWLELRPACVKIDIVFVRGVDRDMLRQAFLRTICDLARASGSRVIAEGIETEEEWACIRKLGIDFGQGYYIQRPSGQPLVSMEHRTMGDYRKTA